MKKFIFIFSVLLAVSCTDDTLTEETKVADATAVKDSLNTLRAGDGAYDVLGAGFNATGDFANANSAGFQVVDIARLKTAQPDRVVEEFPYSQAYNEVYGDDAKDYTETITRKVFAETTGIVPGLFAGTLDFSNITTNKYDNKYVYASYDVTVKNKRLRLNRTATQMQSYLTTSFTEDLVDLTPAELVADYGTHVATDIYTGGRLEVLFRSQTSNSNRDVAAKSLVKAGFLGIFGVAVTNDAQTIENSKNFDKKVWYKTRGGNPNIGIVGQANLDQSTPSLNFSNWQSSCSPSNSVLVDFAPNGLKLIYDFIANPVKKAAVKAYVDQYLIDRKVSLISTPIVIENVASFYNNENFLTTSWSANLPVGNYTLAQMQARGIANDQLTSFKVNPGFEVVLFENGDFSGRSLTSQQAISNLNNNVLYYYGAFNINSVKWNDQTSSIVVRRRP